jgi:hypothetical protein
MGDIIECFEDGNVRKVTIRRAVDALRTATEPMTAREIMRRLGLAGDELPSSLETFVERHIGPERQLTLRLA